MEAARIDRGVPGVDDAAEIRVGAELVALLGARDDMRFDLRAGGRRLHLARQRFVLRGIVRGMKAAAGAEIAIDPLGGDEVGHPGERVVPFLQDARRAFGAVTPRKRVEAGLDAGRDLTAVARAAAEARFLGVEHQRGAAAARRLQRRAQPGVS